MGQLALFEDDPTLRGQHGHHWWKGSWECRNHHGFYQVREDGRGPWQYIIYGFGDDDAVIYHVTHSGDLGHTRVPMDRKDQILVHGRRYGRSHWQH